jgi:hypothetical protein
MTVSLLRRRFVAGLAALAAGGKGPRAAPARVPAANPPVAGSKLYLPTVPGGAASAKFAATPAWAREAPGWYVPDTTSAGLGLLDFPTIGQERIALKLKSFRNLPLLLAEAKAVGLDTIYLVDWYEGLPGARRIDFWEAKGDYVPRSDLGGEAAFKEGVAALHAQGGRIIVYIEGFIFNQKTNVGMAHGAQWSIMRPNGPPAEPYPGNWKLCPVAQGFVSYLEGVAQRIAHYGCDGVFVDSYGYQKDWECVSKAHGHPLGNKQVFNNGAARLMQRLRAGMHAVNPQAIVLTEGPLLEGLFEFTDGSLSSGIHTLVKQWVWDAQGMTDTFTAGWSIDDWHQILALGAKLACPVQFLETPPYGSVTGVIDAFMQRDMPNTPRDLHRIGFQAFRSLHLWRNAGLMLGLPMPSLDDFAGWALGTHVADPLSDSVTTPKALVALLHGLRPTAAAIDAALAGQEPPAATAYLKTLLSARRSIARLIDFGSAVRAIHSDFPRVAAWRFTGANGVALTAANVAEAPRPIVFPNAPGTWYDAVSGQAFTAQGNRLTVPVPAHGIRLLYAG